MKEVGDSNDILNDYFADTSGWGGTVVLCRRLFDDDVIYEKMLALEATYLLYFDERNGEEFKGGWIVYNSSLNGKGIPVLDRWGMSP